MKTYWLVVLPFVFLFPIWLGVWAWLRRRQQQPTQEQLDAARVLIDPRWLRSGWVAWIFEFVYLGALSARRSLALPAVLRAALLIAPLLAFAWFSYVFLREFRRGDEFERRIQGEAAAIALWMFLCWSALMWVMDEIWPAQHHNTFSAALGFLPLMYGVGMFLAKGRYMPTGRIGDEKR